MRTQTFTIDNLTKEELWDMWVESEKQRVKEQQDRMRYEKLYKSANKEAEKFERFYNELK
jgi:hypothetical protein